MVASAICSVEAIMETVFQVVWMGIGLAVGGTMSDVLGSLVLWRGTPALKGCRDSRKLGLGDSQL